ncbi:MAG: sigma-54 dependent transcriptional regulator [Calditrichia bacterium]
MATTPTVPKVLIVEDHLNWQRLYKIWLKGQYDLYFASSRPEAVRLIREEHFDVAVTDLGLPEPEEGLTTIREILDSSPGIKVIVVTGFTDKNLFLHVQKLGVYAVFQKDERLETELTVFIRKAHEMTLLETENKYLRQRFQNNNNKISVLGESDAIQNILQKAGSLARSDTPILITGPTGSGKTHLARYIHELSNRKDKPFVTLNCANLPENLVESELFGHSRGAFTGADRNTEGKFKIANNGTLLLDEIGEIPIHIQAKMLQVIEEKSFYPLGSQTPVSVDVRIVASTNRDLKEEMENGRFRTDLYYRLSGFHLHLPALSQRREDIPALFDHFLLKICQQEDISPPEVEPGVYHILQTYDWPGNIRELINLVTRLLIFRPLKITESDLAEINTHAVPPIVNKAINYELSMKELCKQYARQLVKKYPNKQKVLEILKIDRKTLNRYLEN